MHAAAATLQPPLQPPLATPACRHPPTCDLRSCCSNTPALLISTSMLGQLDLTSSASRRTWARDARSATKPRGGTPPLPAPARSTAATACSTRPGLLRRGVSQWLAGCSVQVMRQQGRQAWARACQTAPPSGKPWPNAHRPCTRTVAPWAASLCAVCAPMPSVAPVTRKVLPSSGTAME